MCLASLGAGAQNIPVVFEERLLFYRERAAKVYGDFSYFITGGVAIFPLTVINCGVFSATLYFMTGFRKDLSSFLFFFLMVSCVSACGLFYCQLLAGE